MRGATFASVAVAGVVLAWQPGESAVVQSATVKKPAAARLRLGGTEQLPSVRGVVFSPDGRMLATRGEPENPRLPRKVHLWNAETGKLVRTITVHDAPLTSVQFSPDGKFLVTGQPQLGNGLQVWDVSTGRLVSRMEGGRGRVQFLPGRNQIAVVSSFGKQDVVRFYDIRTGKEIRRVLIDRNFRFALSADGQAILSQRSAGRQELMLAQIPHVQEFNKRPVFAGSKSAPSVFGFSYDGHTVAAASSHRIDRDKREHHVLVWEVATGRIVYDLKLHTKRVLAIAFSPNHRFIATGGIDKSVKVWELATGKLVHTYEGHTGFVSALAFSPDGQSLASGGFDKTVIVWDFAAKQRSFLPKTVLNEAALKTLWDELSSATPSNAYRAIGRIDAGAGVALPFLKSRLVAILLPAQNKRIQQLIAELDDDKSIVRNRAMRELIKLKKIARPLLVRTLRTTFSAEVKSRLRRILDDSKASQRFNEADEWRMLRIIHAVERSPGKTAEEILELIRKEFPRPRVAREAKKALDRIRGRR